MKNCWDYFNCEKKETCPAYPNEGFKCWEIEATVCRGERQGGYEAKRLKCREHCDFYNEVVLGKKVQNTN